MPLILNDERRRDDTGSQNHITLVYCMSDTILFTHRTTDDTRMFTDDTPIEMDGLQKSSRGDAMSDIVLFTLPFRNCK